MEENNKKVLVPTIIAVTCGTSTVDMGCIRPVFHLTNDTTMSGEGTIESPFIVNK